MAGFYREDAGWRWFERWKIRTIRGAGKSEVGKGLGQRGKGQKLVFKVMQGEQKDRISEERNAGMRKLSSGGPPAHEEEKETHLTGAKQPR